MPWYLVSSEIPTHHGLIKNSTAKFNYNQLLQFKQMCNKTLMDTYPPQTFSQDSWARKREHTCHCDAHCTNFSYHSFGLLPWMWNFYHDAQLIGRHLHNTVNIMLPAMMAWTLTCISEHHETVIYIMPTINDMILHMHALSCECEYNDTIIHIMLA